MKNLIFIKHILQGTALALLCGLISTSCWEGFTDSFIAQYKSVPPDIILGNSTLTASSITLNWTEPDAPSYTGVRITCTGLSEQTVNKGTTTCSLSLTGSTEYTITMTALYNTGDEFVDAEFKVTPDATHTDLYFIYNAAELAVVKRDVICYYILMADIDLSGYTSWTPIDDNFQGVFDGNGHVVQNLRINTTSTTLGLFQNISGTVKNLGLTDVNITGNVPIGALAGYNQPSGTITNSYATGTISGTIYTGGLVGVNYGKIEKCYAAVTVSGTERIGGLVGWHETGTISDSYATGTVTGSGDRVGGLVGYHDFGTISNCFATGTVTGFGHNNGGLVGEKSNAASLISDCYATGAVTGSKDYTGGLVGNNVNGTISSSYATGTVTGLGNYTGGLAGSNTNSGATIRKCYATGAATGSENYTGGLTGYNNGTISNCYATGAVKGSGTRTGGLVGFYNSGTIEYCYASGKVTGTIEVGAFSGEYASTIPTSCFYNSTTSGQSDEQATGMDTDKMRLESTFIDWTFPTIWLISSTVNNGFPYLYGNEP